MSEKIPGIPSPHHIDLGLTQCVPPTGVLGPAAGYKLDQGKLPWHLLSVCAIEELVKVLEFGSKKYDAHNWRKGMSWTRILSASFRHLAAFLRGEDRCPETGLLHTAHLMCNAMFLTEYAIRKVGTDDRFVE